MSWTGKTNIFGVSACWRSILLPSGPGPWSMLPNQGFILGNPGTIGHDHRFMGFVPVPTVEISVDDPLLADIRTHHRSLPPPRPSPPYFLPSSPCPELLHHLQSTPQNVHPSASHPTTRAGPRRPTLRKLRRAHRRIRSRGATTRLHGRATAAGPGTILQLRGRRAAAAVHTAKGRRARDTEDWHDAQDEVVEDGGDGSHHRDGGGRDRGRALRVSSGDLDSGRLNHLHFCDNESSQTGHLIIIFLPHYRVPISILSYLAAALTSEPRWVSLGHGYNGTTLDTIFFFFLQYFRRYCRGLINGEETKRGA